MVLVFRILNILIYIFIGGNSMKIQNIFYMVTLLVISDLCHGMMAAYHNIITDIQDIQGATTYTLVITCTQLEPIAVYAPETYQESLNNQQVTIFMPNTTLAEGVEEIPGMVEVVSSGVTIFLAGKLKQKLIGNHKISITIEVVS